MDYGEGPLSDDFKDLISSMFDYYPSKRLIMADLISHPWVQGVVPTQDEIIEEFSKREAQVKEQEEKEKKEHDFLEGGRVITPPNHQNRRGRAVHEGVRYIKDQATLREKIM